MAVGRKSFYLFWIGSHFKKNYAKRTRRSFLKKVLWATEHFRLWNWLFVSDCFLFKFFWLCYRKNLRLPWHMREWRMENEVVPTWSSWCWAKTYHFSTDLYQFYYYYWDPLLLTPNRRGNLGTQTIQWTRTVQNAYYGNMKHDCDLQLWWTTRKMTRNKNQKLHSSDLSIHTY
jgi:hypothetical protein